MTGWSVKDYDGDGDELGEDDYCGDETFNVHHDMSAPVSHYFIYTGHNSYLTGNQLSSDCSDVPIIKALQRGVRVIELDMWPNSTKDDIDILHGRTLTTPVALIKCLRSIKEHAFSASPYPVVITLEDHLTSDLQAKVAEMVTETFGNMLFTPGPECLKEFPSPESLKKRILISTKPPKEYLEAKSIKEKGSVSQKGNDSAEEEAWGKEVPDLKPKFEADDKSNPDVGEDSPEDEDLDDGDRKQQSTEPEYKRLISIHAGKPKGGIEEALKIDPNKVRRLSLSEPALEKAAITHGTNIVSVKREILVHLLKSQSSRGIISCLHYGESPNHRRNLDLGHTWGPDARWYLYLHHLGLLEGSGSYLGDGYGRSLWLMQGMFRANGGCGYIKKPEFLLKVGPHNEVFDPRATLPVKQILKVRVYMGEGWHMDFQHTHFDVYSPPDFYTRVGIAGVPADSVMKKTKTIEDNWTPVWNEEFEFPLTVPELALLRIEVHEYDMSEKDDFGGQTCLPLSELRAGIRAVPLYSRKGEKYKCVKLLMSFELFSV
ncbi:hypothetical protein IFM89_014526 [Coptis chinensis]|uniref:Phosphoinositide phospholipase C n=1 Tax=Coptis chinensis TaxID=261450 RepID=A0A835LLJ2_9MAGN|nr:hypothetical protein IFM89_014526 [Coptis chinensis]